MEQIAPYAPRIAARMAGVQASEIRELLKIADQPGVISFGGGIPDPALFPRVRIEAVYADILSDPARAAMALQYSTSEGDPDLRAFIAEGVRAEGYDCRPDNILITNGAQQGLDYLGRLLVDEGAHIMAGWPTYLGALQAFAPNRPRYLPLRSGQNRDAEGLRDAAGSGGVAMAYVVPEFANPTGETMTLADREGLLAMARALDFPVIEDNPYGALRFEGTALPALQALDVGRVGSLDASRVIRLGSFSKVLTPGLRVGWVCAARSVIDRLVLMKQAGDLNCARLNQMAVLDIARGGLGPQIERVRDSYRAKRDAMLAALETAMPAGVGWTRPEGGMFLWLTLPEGMDAARTLPEAIAAGVAYVPGAAFFPDRGTANCMRLSYSLASAPDIAEGIDRLSRVLARHLPG
ncbi:PLP-dependent aminotransferase family protein [Jannaschia pohangensis]|uniref:DNA-binding transcriptional regulator, MocR family, contains an aminotransferase domain n=1 Tax=Jannaschia pohangensis TaxID=390807 RepID=A0A1I3J865_9RHOB|nr:PLP-dependent aminotransferase family protein [Jannaschia pohangensis]SFI56370.1 DNA-binding transcriptional regulator, MocR family, contains an aminotransferase domain [Jannaschia pohangensis]